MTNTRRMIQTNPSSALVDAAALVECIEACFECAQTCTACADACLGEKDVNPLIECIRDDLDCANICIATGNVLSRQTQPSQADVREILQACAASCKQCGDTCEEHAEHHEHCLVCMEACRRCESACNNVLSAMAARLPTVLRGRPFGVRSLRPARASGTQSRA